MKFDREVFIAMRPISRQRMEEVQVALRGESVSKRNFVEQNFLLWSKSIETLGIVSSVSNFLVFCAFMKGRVQDWI